MVKVLVPLAEGFEEIEAVTIVDVLRRAGVEVTVAALAERVVTGSHGIGLIADALLSEIEPATFDAIALPGGPGVAQLRADGRIRQLLVEMQAAQKWTAAICAAPTVLSDAGLLAGVRATSYPALQPELVVGEYLETSVVVDRRIVTSRGVGTALDFALKLVALLVDEKTAGVLARAMVVVDPAPAAST
ncbi:DJ-1 family glyoxalase III [Gloeobacter kilaueensis]|uniref:DJ-1 family protein n=1 Tax=Gloeobacter kilaueensis (strain ATCC BAA-2537 / CCAP 1431/1 / ULC 316 / JS1) TaxID=1183438 RepID=U5QPA9_GLOK1|nr:DJ-1 family glyoxalase III [Gloeobacter kilaueensis]AGY60738.1 DJ-1 family protein [Gloeobacter kilaueensis JS1]